MKKPTTTISLLAFFMFGGCAQFSGALDTGINATKIANDKIANILIQANCGMSVGAYWRVLNAQKRQAVNILCGGDGKLSE